MSVLGGSTHTHDQSAQKLGRLYVYIIDRTSADIFAATLTVVVHSIAAYVPVVVVADVTNSTATVTPGNVITTSGTAAITCSDPP